MSILKSYHLGNGTEVILGKMVKQKLTQCA